MYERVSQRLQTRASSAEFEVPEIPDPEGFRVFEYGNIAFEEILTRIAQAEKSLEMRAFLWRDDEAGTRIGQAVLSAADRGVQVTIEKDRIAAVYEYAAGSQQSFFHKRVAPTQGLQAFFLRAFTQAPARLGKQRPNPLAEAILNHPNITVNHKRRRFDHSKVFVFDNRYVTLGSMGIGDNHLHEWVDVMVEIEGEEHANRLRQRTSGEVTFDPDRDVDFLVHNRQTARRRHCPLLEQRLALMEAARESLTIEMAYMGDRRFTTALLRAIKRGVRVTLVTAALADILGQANRSIMNTLMQRTGFPDNLTIILMPRMVHSKVMVVDHKISDVGSANFTPLSHGVYDEINLYAVNRELACAVERVIALHAEEGERVEGPLGYRRFASGVERAVMAFHGRKSGRLNRSQMPRDQRLALKRQERQEVREEKRNHRVNKRRQRAERRQLRSLAKREGRADKREEREARKSQRLRHKRELKADKRAARAEKRRARELQKQERKADKQERKADKRELKADKREAREQKRQESRAARQNKREVRASKRELRRQQRELRKSAGRKTKNPRDSARVRRPQSTNRRGNRR